jgi:RNA polymerase subunit RPABC4/transcription elongation factor Spt4
LPSLLFGSVLSNTLNRPQPYPVPYPVQPPPTPGQQPAQTGIPAVNVPALATVACQHCSQVVNAGFTFCPHCGSHLASNACRYCGQVMTSAQGYCPNCGAPRR